MRHLFFLAAGGLALAAAAMMGQKPDSTAPSAADGVLPFNVERFMLQGSGNEKICAVEKIRGEGSVSFVVLAPACDDILSGLSGLRYWREAADGTVMLSGDGATPAVVFAVADGVAYESIEPKTPLIALISRE